MSVDREVLERFKERIAASLDERSLRATAAEHGARLGDLLARAGGENHFELLGLSLAADDKAVAVAYEARARLAHPRNAAALGLEGTGTLELLFERLTEAYLALSDSQRRRAYLAWLDLPPRVTEGKSNSGEARGRELARLARDVYRNARSLAAQADYFSAISLLEQAVALDPRSEYLALLARCQAQNPQWLGRAAASLERAIELDPESAELRCALGEVHEQAGEVEEARAMFNRALELLPGFDRARDGLDRLGGGGFRFGWQQAVK